MKKILNRFLLILSLSAFAVSLYQVLQHWDYEETLVDLNQSLRNNITKEQISNEIEVAIDTAEFDDARMYLAIAKSNNYSVDFETYQAIIKQKDTKLRQIVTQASNFTEGFLEGKGANMAGIAGSVTADFSVIGDARDLKREYKKHQDGQDVNELIILLSGAGIGLTALTVSSMGTAAPAKAGASVIKVAVKTQRVTRGFQKHLVKLGRKVFDWPVFTRLVKQNKSTKNIRRAAKQAYHPEAIKPLKRIANQVNRIRKSTSTIDTVHLFKYIDSPKDLARLEKISLKYGNKTKGMMKLLGKGALRTVRVLRKTTELLISLFSSLLSGMFSFALLFRKLLF